ncbi:MAG TPA: hypothetical protein VOB72_20355 [Candidatus Dormibacteraeota bacterium]|nr:hypothetical protein [Candidatus Dormibacteraeota bacterium]
MNQLTAGLIVVIGILGGFYIGAKYGQGHPPASANTAAATTGTGAGRTGAGGGAGGNGGGFAGGGGGGAGAGAFGNATVGQITAVNGDEITVHDARTNKDVKINVASARISKTTDGSPSDLTQNTTVTVVGQTGSDGTVTATVVSIGNGTAAFGGGGRRGTGASPSPGT